MAFIKPIGYEEGKVDKSINPFRAPLDFIDFGHADYAVGTVTKIFTAIVGGRYHNALPQRLMFSGHALTGGTFKLGAITLACKTGDASTAATLATSTLLYQQMKATATLADVWTLSVSGAGGTTEQDAALTAIWAAPAALNKTVWDADRSTYILKEYNVLELSVTIVTGTAGAFFHPYLEVLRDVI